MYVDDIILTNNDLPEINCLKTRLAQSFEVKDLNPLRYFLGIEVARSSHGIFLSQQKYVLDLLTETDILGCRPAATLIEQTIILWQMVVLQLIGRGINAYWDD